MLEKLTGNANAQNLRAMLLLEANFNALHEIIFNDRPILNLEVTGAMLIEVIGWRRS